eukprot:2180900-Amphidinium_carterae.1
MDKRCAPYGMLVAVVMGAAVLVNGTDVAVTGRIPDLNHVCHHTRKALNSTFSHVDQSPNMFFHFSDSQALA